MDTADNGQTSALSVKKADLLGLAGPLAGRRISLADRVVIGRGHDVDIIVDGEDVSRRHATIWRTQAGEFMIEDLGSRNGTLVNGVRIELHVLRFGDKIQVGTRSLLAFSEHSAAEEQIVQCQRLELIGQMAAGVVHDFDNCMQVVVGNVDLMRVLLEGESPDFAELSQCLDDISAAAEHGSGLTRKVLGFARSSGKRLTDVDLADLMEETVGMMRRSFPESVRIDCEDVERLRSKDLRVKGDRTELLQVLINLLSNARDAMPDGGVVSMQAEKRTLTAEECARVPVLSRAPAVVVCVSDSGVGIEQEALSRVFEALFTTKKPGKGTGLGLATVQRITRDHGGDISVNSTEGKGATFTVMLPARTEHGGLMERATIIRRV